jgi:GH24 family phage-related lysozyme (muramidase)
VKTSDVGIHLMHEFEGYRNRPYKCSAKIWTVGWGHAMYSDQLRLPNVRTGTYTGMIRKDDCQLKPEDSRVWTKEETRVEIIQADDVATFERSVLRLAPNLCWPSRRKFDALCIYMAFNFGLGNLQRSTIRHESHSARGLEGRSARHS